MLLVFDRVGLGVGLLLLGLYLRNRLLLLLLDVLDVLDDGGFAPFDVLALRTDKRRLSL